MSTTCDGPDQQILVAAESIALRDTHEAFDREARRAVCDTGRYRCSYYVWGNGPPLVCIPGLSDNSRAFLLLCSRLSQSFRCIAYDLPNGRGDGARLRHYQHADLVNDLFTIMDHAGVPQGYVFGYSFGSTITLAAMHARPERIPRAILQGGFARRPLAPAENLLTSLARYWPGAMRSLPFRTATLRHSHYLPFAKCPRDRWEFFVQQCGSPPIAAVAHYARLVHRLDLRSLLKEIRQPVLLVGGDCDPTVCRNCEEEVVHGLPKAQRVELSHCGHYPLFTHPEVLAEIVRRFLTLACEVREQPANNGSVQT